MDLDLEGQTTIWKAVEVLNAKCMKLKGFDYLPYPPPEGQFSLEPNFRYGFISEADAVASAYDSTSPRSISPERQRAMSAVDDVRARVPGFNEALYGDGNSTSSAQSCNFLSRREVYGSDDGFDKIEGSAQILAMQQTSIDQLYTSPQGLKALADWSRCMQERGYKFDTWWDAREAASKLARNEQKTQALTDSRCRSRVQLEVRLFDVETAIMSKMIEDAPELIKSYRRSIDSVVSRAKIIAGST